MESQTLFFSAEDCNISPCRQSHDYLFINSSLSTVDDYERKYIKKNISQSKISVSQFVKMNPQERNYCNLYFRIRHKYQEHYKRIDPSEWCSFLNDLLQKLPHDQAVTIGTAIYVLMLQHEKLSSAMPRDVAYGGTNSNIGYQFQFSAIPPSLQQFLRIFIEEISTNTAPEQIP